MANHIRELEEEINRLKNRPLWQLIWNDIKPKRESGCGYNRYYKWEKFLEKMFWVILAVFFAIAVFVGNYFLLKHARNWTGLY